MLYALGLGGFCKSRSRAATSRATLRPSAWSGSKAANTRSKEKQSTNKGHKLCTPLPPLHLTRLHSLPTARSSPTAPQTPPSHSSQD